MPSSYVDSVPPIVHALVRINPRAVLDVGPGWGKYGVMCREYLADLECIEAAEVREGVKPTIHRIYDELYVGDIRERQREWWKCGTWDTVLLIDIIEHMSMADGHHLLDCILESGKRALISTPTRWFEQHVDGNPYEDHVSHWEVHDLADRYPVAANVSTLDSLIMVLGRRLP